MANYILQIVHDVPKDGQHEGGKNVIEMSFEKLYSAEAEGRRHAKQPHKIGVGCEMYMFEGDFTIELEHAGHEESVPGCKVCEDLDAQEDADSDN